MIVSLVKWVLKRNLSIEDRNKIVTSILDNLDALPLQEAVKQEEGEILIHGFPLDLEKARTLRESARAALDNQSLKIVREQVVFVAIALGVHTVESERQMLFARAAIWYHQQLEKHLKILAQREQEPILE